MAARLEFGKWVLHGGFFLINRWWWGGADSQIGSLSVSHSAYPPH